MCFQISYRVFGIDVIAAVLDEPERSFGTGNSGFLCFYGYILLSQVSTLGLGCHFTLGTFLCI